MLDIIAAQMKVVQIARIKKSCRRCEKMVQEPAPSRPIPGSMAGPNLLAHVLVSKFDDFWTSTKSEIAREALDRIHDHKINRLDELLPWHWAPLNAAHSEAA